MGHFDGVVEIYHYAPSSFFFTENGLVGIYRSEAKYDGLTKAFSLNNPESEILSVSCIPGTNSIVDYHLVQRFGDRANGISNPAVQMTQIRGRRFGRESNARREEQYERESQRLQLLLTEHGVCCRLTARG